MIPMRVLITGATGFVGGHLAEALLKRPAMELFALCRKTAWTPEWAHLADRIPLHTADLVEATNLSGTLAAIRPDWIFHLAAYAHVGQSSHEPDLAWKTNRDRTRKLYHALAAWRSNPRL